MVNHKLLKTSNSAMRISMINRLSLIAILVIFMTGCDGNQTTSSIADTGMNLEIHTMNNLADQGLQGADSDLIKLVRRATSRYHSTTQAVRAGYEGDGHCVEVPNVGGMGYHWVNGGLIDPYFDPANPEALLYEPDKNGNLKLVGLEYIVINVGQERPHFGDHPFDIDGVPPLMENEVPHWSLHVWFYKENPNGMFTPFNPNVSC